MRGKVIELDGIENVEVLVPFRRNEFLRVIAFRVDGFGGNRCRNGGLSGNADGFLRSELLGEGVERRRSVGVVVQDGGLVVLRILAETSRIDELDVERWARRQRVRRSGSGTRQR